MIRIANSPSSWGVLEFDWSTSGYGSAQVLDEIAASGYDGTELGTWGFMPSDPRVLRAELAARHLELVGAFVPVALADPAQHAKGQRVAVRTAELLRAASDAQPIIVLADDNGSVAARVQHAGRVCPDHGLSDRQWDMFAAGAEHIARAVREATGLRTVFHPHCAGYVETPTEIEALMNRTDPDLLGLCLDTGHALYGGGDPTEIVRRYRYRVRHVHFKDYEPHIAERARSEQWDYFTAVGHGIFCELGQGCVDWGTVTAELRDRRYDGWIVVEQDLLSDSGTPAESARRNREYLRSIGL